MTSSSSSRAGWRRTMRLLSFSSILLCSTTITSVTAQTYCCEQVEFAGPGCTSVAWCSSAQANCEGDCEGSWIVDPTTVTCTAEGETCQPTSPVKCCDPFDCTDVDVQLNLGTCGTTTPTTSAPTVVGETTAPNPSPVVTTSPPIPGSGDVRRTYFFGHSLIYHTFTSYPNVNDLSVPYWLNLLGAATGESWLADGMFRTNNYPLPAQPNWGWSPDISGWDNNFANSNYDSVVYTELNYVQYKGPSEGYDYDDREAPTPVDSLVRIIDYVQSEGDVDTPIYLYECWDGMNTYPPTSAQTEAYYQSQQVDGSYHMWWTELHMLASNRRPTANLILLPVAPILTSVLQTYLPSVPFVDLFEDGAPHGRPTPYFLASLITYVAMTGGQAPDPSYVIPSVIHPDVVTNYDDIVDLIVEQVTGTTTAPSPVTTSSPVAGTNAPTVSTPTTTVTSSPTTSPPVGGVPCCEQLDHAGPGCTNVDWCNAAQDNCEGDCEGVWGLIGTPPSPSSPTLSPVIEPTTPSPIAMTEVPVSSPVASPVAMTDPPSQPPVSGAPCCVQLDFAGPGCTIVPWCNEEQANCEGDCEGVWTVIGTPPSPTSSPVSAPTEPPQQGPSCTAEGETCQPTSPLRCCAPFDCIDVDVIVNLGTCGIRMPTSEPPPSPSPPTVQTSSPTRTAPPPTPSNGVKKTYFFGHSLIYHTFTDYFNLEHMSVPSWLHLLGAAAGQQWLADGQFRYANYPLPPNPDWGWTPSISGWEGDSFANSNYDSVVYTELNFAQYKPPTEPYDYYDPVASTPVDSVVRIVDFIEENGANGRDTPLYIYECWGELAGNFPPSESQKQAFYQSMNTAGAYHQWWVDLYDAVVLARPLSNVQLVPVSPILFQVLTTYLPSVPMDEVFEDGAPHGLPTVYFLASLIQYIAMTGERPDPSYVVPTDGTIHSDVSYNYDGIVDLIYNELGGTTSPSPITSPTPYVTDPPVSSPVSSPTVSPSDPCCVQPDFSGGVGCTPVAWCNEAQSHCEGACEGVWTVVTP